MSQQQEQTPQREKALWRPLHRPLASPTAPVPPAWPRGSPGALLRANWGSVSCPLTSGKYFPPSWALPQALPTTQCPRWQGTWRVPCPPTESVSGLFRTWLLFMASSSRTSFLQGRWEGTLCPSSACQHCRRHPACSQVRKGASRWAHRSPSLASARFAAEPVPLVSFGRSSCPLNQV